MPLFVLALAACTPTATETVPPPTSEPTPDTDTSSVVTDTGTPSTPGAWAPPTEGRWVPAEWDPQQAVWLQWPRWYERTYERTFAEMVATILAYEDVHVLVHDSATATSARQALLQVGVDEAVLQGTTTPGGFTLTWHDIPNDSAWMRDNGPRYVVEDGALRIQDWGFDAWGGAFGPVPYADDDAVPAEVGAALGLPVDVVELVHERGDLEFNGRDTVILNWTVIGDPARNPGLTRDAAIEAMEQRFGVSRVVLIEGQPSGDLTGGHVDGIARFIDHARVVVADCSSTSACQPGDGDDEIYDAAAASLAEAGLEVIRWPFQAAVTHRGQTFDTDYMNWLVGNGFVITVGFDHVEADAAARAQLEAWFPGRDVHVIEALDSWVAGGGIHCHTNDQPRWPW
jgi:agmatine deiminase